jgi:hypothetical protein
MGWYDLEKTGALPNSFGDMEAQKVWVLEMDSLVYKAATPVVAVSQPVADAKRTVHFSVHSRNSCIVFSAENPGTASIFTTDGRCISSTVFKNAGNFTRTAVPGCYTVRFESTGRIESVPVVVY